MKSIQIRYSNTFIWAPMTGWVPPFHRGFWVQNHANARQWRKPDWVRNPILSLGRKFAQRHAHLDGINMVFALPNELDHFVDVMSKNPLPRGRSVHGGAPVGLPNRHWLSRFPAKGKSWKFRQKVVRFLSHPHKAVSAFRDFYQGQDLSGLSYLSGGAPMVGQGTRNDPYRRAE